MTAARGHGPPRSEEEGLAELQRCAGTQFDPRVVVAVVAVVGRRERNRPVADELTLDPASAHVSSLVSP